MDIMSQTLKELAEENDQPVELNTNPVEETPAEDPKPVESDKPEETSADVDKPEESPEPEEKPVEDKKPPKDTSQFTKEEKAEFAFRRQLNKQKEKHAQEIQDIVKSFDKKFEDFKQSLSKKEPEPVKQRDAFENDDDYIKYLVKQGMDEERASIKAEQDKADKEREEQEAKAREYEEQQQRYLDAFSANCATAIPEEEREDFSAKVKLAKENGLANLLDQAPVVRNYIFTTKRGPKLLHAMLKERDIFANVMETAAMSVDPMAAYIELDDIARNYQYKKPEPQPEPEQRTMPHLGKPGSGGAKADAKDITTDDMELIKFMRSRR